MRRAFFAILFLLVSLTMSADLTSAFQQQNQQSNDPNQQYETLIDTWRQQSDSTPVYQGVLLKVDLLNSIIEPALSHGRNQTYEAALSVRLKNRFYPIIEGGYSQYEFTTDSILTPVRGGFGRIGIDINGLKKNAEALDGILIGLRLGSDFQRDCWAEFMLGIQVNIASGFIMGWNVGVKTLFTKAYANYPEYRYIPGYGHRSDTNITYRYYIGWKF